MFKALLFLVLLTLSGSGWSATGYLQNGVCHETYDAAMSVRFNDYQLVPSGTPNTISWVQKSASGWVFTEYNRTTMALVRTLSLPALTFPACEYSTSEQDAINQLTGITSVQVLYVFSWGFGSVVLFWFFGYVIAVAIQAIKKV